MVEVSKLYTRSGRGDWRLDRVPRKSRDHFGALLMGMYFGKALKYIGSVGTGFNRAMLERTRKTLDRLAIAESPFDTTPQLRELAHWSKT